MLKDIIKQLNQGLLIKKIEEKYPFLSICQKIAEAELSLEIEFAKASRYLDILDVDYVWSKEDLSLLSSLDCEINFEYWRVSDLVRTALLLSLEKPNDVYYIVIKNCYKRGNNKEQICILKALSLLKDVDKYTSLALDAIRTNIPEVLASIACGNPYPFRSFTENQFNNMVLKCIFMGIPISTIFGLSHRQNQELCRMVNEYINEREAAHREFPKDIWMAIYPTDEKYCERMCRYLVEKNDEHRYWVAKSLDSSCNQKIIPYLEKQLQQQHDEKTKLLLHNKIEKIRSSS